MTLNTFSYVKQEISTLRDSFIKLENDCPILIVFWFIKFLALNISDLSEKEHYEHFNPSLAGFFIFVMVELKFPKLGKVQVSFIANAFFFCFLFHKYFPALQSREILTSILL